MNNSLPDETKAPVMPPETQESPEGRVAATPIDAGHQVKSRHLLKQMRQIMASDGEDETGESPESPESTTQSGQTQSLTAQQRLDRIVRLVARELAAEVCSIYVMRAGEVLELFATEGLRIEAIHRTRLRTGEGLTGMIAAQIKPLVLADAWAHPNFVYRPETGEDIYRSFLGVPIRRSGRVLGVIIIQNRTTRHYTEDEVETIETIAMVLGELIASGDLVSSSEINFTEPLAVKPGRYEGMKINPGISIGRAILHRPLITIKEMLTDDPDRDIARLDAAVEGMQSSLADLFESDMPPDIEVRDVFETYRMFANDRGWLNRIREAIQGGLSVEAAVQKTHQEQRARLRDIADPYLRERLSDFEDLTNRLMLHLSGQHANSRHALTNGQKNGILIARSMGPVELLEYDRRSLRGLILEEGSPTSHVAIVARAFDIPVIGRVKDLLDRVDHGDILIVDGDNGQVFVRPSEEIEDSFRQIIAKRSQQRETFRAMRDLAAVSVDNQRVTLYANAGLLSDAIAAEEVGADGIGLYRTELGYMLRSGFPSLSAQTEVYRRVLEVAPHKPVIFRTLDIGGDKMLPYFPIDGDENPAMGWRSIRISLDRPILLRLQLRAMLRAAAGRELAVMFPMIATVEEFDRARALLDREIADLASSGGAIPSRVKVGIMVEVPALFWQVPEFLRRVDFMSIGSNDLLQFIFASDRGSSRMSNRYDSLSPAILRALRDLSSSCRAAGVELSVCGEMAGQPLEAMALLGIGIRSLSMSPVLIGVIRQMVRNCHIAELQAFVGTAIDRSSSTIRPELRSFVREQFGHDSMRPEDPEADEQVD
ncbi:MAG: phosphoenolpyruvate--protein phosphotransferase [Candidatus Pacebacteria bacterium]|nr:phosphoenolpyruvate--protein phosphotransferase [Candidatus Paceibacterota bacterium]